MHINLDAHKKRVKNKYTIRLLCVCSWLALHIIHVAPPTGLEGPDFRLLNYYNAKDQLLLSFVKNKWDINCFAVRFRAFTNLLIPRTKMYWNLPEISKFNILLELFLFLIFFLVDDGFRNSYALHRGPILGPKSVDQAHLFYWRKNDSRVEELERRHKILR